MPIFGTGVVRRGLAVALLAYAALPGGARASVVISADPSKNIICSAGVCAPTTKNAVLNATDLANMLASSDVKVVTGNGAVTITVSSPFSWTSGDRLTLDAYYNVSFRAPIVVAGPGEMTIVTNDGGTGGDLIFFDNGRIDFWDLESHLTVNRVSYIFVDSLRGLKDAISADPRGAYALTKNVTLQHTFHNAPIKTFLGNFEGLGHTIQNLTISHGGRKKPTYQGLFGQITLATIRDVRLSNVQISVNGEDAAVGALVGSNINGLISGVSVSGNLTGATFQTMIGGVVGFNEGGVYNSSFEGTITGTSQDYMALGGIAGESLFAIARSHVNATIVGPAAIAGGIVGSLCGSILDSDFSGSASGWIAGGIAGSADCGQTTTIDRSFATGNITGLGEAGGILGEVNPAISSGPITVSNSYSTAAIAGGDAGGLVGLSPGNSVNLWTSYSLGAPSSNTGGYVGGSLGNDNPNTARQNLYWDLDTSGISDPKQGAGNIVNDPGLKGLTDAELKAKLPAGFGKGIWQQDSAINDGYPYLIDNPPPQ